MKGKKLINKVKTILNKVKEKTKDPCKHCEVYLNEGCSHVDGMFCNMKNCSILGEYKKEQEKKIFEELEEFNKHYFRMLFRI